MEGRMVNLRSAKITLYVLMNGILVGRLEKSLNGLLSFSYEEAWLNTEQARPVSFSTRWSGWSVIRCHRLHAYGSGFSRRTELTSRGSSRTATEFLRKDPSSYSKNWICGLRRSGAKAQWLNTPRTRKVHGHLGFDDNWNVGFTDSLWTINHRHSIFERIRSPVDGGPSEHPDTLFTHQIVQASAADRPGRAYQGPSSLPRPALRRFETLLPLQEDVSNSSPRTESIPATTPVAKRSDQSLVRNADCRVQLPEECLGKTSRMD